MAGFGRSGKLFGFCHAPSVVPDIITFAKGVNGAYLPLGGVGVRDHVAECGSLSLFLCLVTLESNHRFARLVSSARTRLVTGRPTTDIRWRWRRRMRRCVCC
jgi:acetylornithine/succinyldiaminopimelate/putrescine aminotransferase